MFDSMEMHAPVIVFLSALVLLVLIAGIFVFFRVAGQRVVDSESHDQGVPPAESIGKS